MHSIGQKAADDLHSPVHSPVVKGGKDPESEGTDEEKNAETQDERKEKTRDETGGTRDPSVRSYRSCDCSFRFLR